MRRFHQLGRALSSFLSLLLLPEGDEDARATCSIAHNKHV